MINKIDDIIQELNIKRLNFSFYLNTSAKYLDTEQKNFLLKEYITLSEDIKAEIERLELIKKRLEKIRKINENSINN